MPNTKVLYNKILFISITQFIILIFDFFIFYTAYSANDYSFTIFEKVHSIPENYWNIFKVLHLVSTIIISLLTLTKLSNRFCNNCNIATMTTSTNNNDELSLYVGHDTKNGEDVFISEQGLYQNILVTGTIGTGKTSSAMYPFAKQLIKQNIGMLVLDVKGNFYKKIKEFASMYNKKTIVIELGGNETYNPLDKPNLKPSVLANRLRTILTLFSNQNTTDTYWLDKVESFLTEAIKLCRLYNDGYVTFVELHKIIYDKAYLNEKIAVVKKLFFSNKFSNNQIYELNTCLDFFLSEFKNLDSKVLSIIQSEISRITQLFINDLEVKNTFCPPKNKITFKGFQDLENSIVVLNMNVAEYRNLAKILATYLKLDFESEVLMRLARSHTIKPVAFICDEYHEFVTENDANFFSESREAKCINIISTQSYTSLLNSVKNQSAAKVIIQSLVNKIWFRTDDIFTIEEAQKQLGKEDKIKYSHSISENAKETKYNYLFNTFKSNNSNLSESISTQIQHDFTYDTNSFSLDLKTFHAICFFSTGNQISTPKLVRLTPLHEMHDETIDIPDVSSCQMKATSRQSKFI